MNGLTNVEEKVLSGHRNGAFVLILTIFLYILSVFGFMIGIAGAVDSDSFAFVLLTVVCVLWFLFGWILFLGLKVLKPIRPVATKKLLMLTLKKLNNLISAKKTRYSTAFFCMKILDKKLKSIKFYFISLFINILKI